MPGNHRSGRKPQPASKKKAKGETRPSRTQKSGGNVLEFPVIENQVPDPPEWLGPRGKKLWGRIVPLLYNQHVLTEADLPALETLCAIYDSVHKKLEAGMEATAAEYAQLRMYYSEFGLTASSRTRVGRVDDGKGKNGFSRNGPRGKQGKK